MTRWFQVTGSLWIACVLGMPTAKSATSVTRDGAKWLMENERLRVAIESDAGRVRVFDKEARYTWRQPGEPSRQLRLALRQAATPPRIDGSEQEWTGAADIRLTHEMLADARRVDSDADCSAQVFARWNDDGLHLLARVSDDNLQWGARGLRQWWEKDSIELWVGSTQVGLNLSPQGSQFRSATARLDGGRIALKTGAGGYTVEALLPWSLVDRRPPKSGETLPFAIGVNDADSNGSREGQLYFPRTWKHSQPDTFAIAVLADSDGSAPAAADSDNVFRKLSPVRDGVRFETRVPEVRVPIIVTVTAPPGRADLVVDVDLADRETGHPAFVALEPFALPVEHAALAVADYCNGHLYPLDLEPFPKAFFNGNRLDMPWVGITDLDSGRGYALILATSDDCGVHMEQRQTGGRTVRVPRVRWWASFKQFRYPRRMIYRFCAEGGYVALAKAYRQYARERGLLVTLAEKTRRNPNVERLFGAPDVWGDASLKFAREAKSLGVDKMLIHGVSSAEEMRQINALGYLTSKYDNYTDILPVEPGKEINHNHGRLPDDAVLLPNGKRMTAWLTFDKKTQYMKRCPQLWLQAARHDIPAELKLLPYLGRFIDVTTAESLYECFDPRHPMTRTQKRLCGQRLEKYVNRELGLVGGGEHGIWWGVPSMCYVEGMMSGGFYSWPAGHLKHPRSKDQDLGNPWGRKLPPFSEYEKYGIGHRYRVPLWELVFHDCLVTTWYWGDASDWLLDAAPEVTPKKDAFNVLYGTIPLLWANGEGSWQKDRSVFLNSYRSTCKLHEQIAGEEMLSHESLTPDRDVQRTVFSSGTEVVVNFGAEPRPVKVKGQRFLLPQNGFVVRGPKVNQSLVLVDSRPVTTIQAPGYRQSDAYGTEVTMRSAGRERVLAIVEPTHRAITLRPDRVAPGWSPSSTLVYALDEEGKRVQSAQWRSRPAGILLPPSSAQRRLEVLWGAQTAKPDVYIVPGTLRSVDEIGRGAGVALEMRVANRGLAPASAVLSVYADQTAPARLLARVSMLISAAGAQSEMVRVPTIKLAGRHKLMVRVACRGDELCTADNRTYRPLQVEPDGGLWPYRVEVAVDTHGRTGAGEPVVMGVDFRTLLRRVGASGPLDAASVRVGIAGGDDDRIDLLPTQFEPADDFDPRTNPKGALCWLLPSNFDGRSRQRFAILFRAGKPALLPPAADAWRASEYAIETDGYRARFSDGVLVSLAPKVNGSVGPDFLQSLVLSSQATGWTQEEASTVEGFEVLHSGPVRTLVRVEKQLKAGVSYMKTYTFYPHRFDVEIDVNKPAGGLYSRAHYRLPGRFVDNAGLTAKVDGDGEENRATYGQTKNPRWYAMLGDGWAHSCIALSKFNHIAYWDGGNMGAIGFVTPEHHGVRMSYVIHGAEADASFAEQDYQRLASPPAARLLP